LDSHRLASDKRPSAGLMASCGMKFMLRHGRYQAASHPGRLDCAKQKRFRQSRSLKGAPTSSLRFTSFGLPTAAIQSRPSQSLEPKTGFSKTPCPISKGKPFGSSSRMMPTALALPPQGAGQPNSPPLVRQSMVFPSQGFHKPMVPQSTISTTSFVSILTNGNPSVI
jgi:hypothetical protein